MTKKERKKISDIAEKLPVVYEQTISGYSEEGGQIVPNVQNNPINHKRRMCKAYEKLGLDGVKQYLDYIRQLQEKRNARFRDDQGSGVHNESDGDSGQSDQDGLHYSELEQDRVI